MCQRPLYFCNIFVHWNWQKFLLDTAQHVFIDYFYFFPNNSLTLVCAASKGTVGEVASISFQISLSDYTDWLSKAQKVQGILKYTFGGQPPTQIVILNYQHFSIVLTHQALSYFLKRDPLFNNIHISNILYHKVGSSRPVCYLILNSIGQRS